MEKTKEEYEKWFFGRDGYWPTPKEQYDYLMKNILEEKKKEAIEFAEFISDARGDTRDDVYINRNSFGIKSGYYSLDQLYNKFKGI